MCSSDLAMTLVPIIFERTQLSVSGLAVLLGSQFTYYGGLMDILLWVVPYIETQRNYLPF